MSPRAGRMELVPEHEDFVYEAIPEVSGGMNRKGPRSKSGMGTAWGVSN